MQSGAHRLMCRFKCFDVSTMIVHPQNAKKQGLLKRNPGPLRILHCLFHLGMLFLLLFLLRQKQLDLLLHTLELLFLRI